MKKKMQRHSCHNEFCIGYSLDWENGECGSELG